MKRMLILGGVALLGAGLTACYPTPTPDPSTTLSLQLPADTDWQNLTLAAVYYEADPANPDKYVTKVLTQTYGGYGYSNLTIWTSELNKLANNPNCTTPFITGEAKGKIEVTVTPNTVKTCNIQFLAFRSTSSNSTPTNDNLVYLSHDIYSYATEAFSYSMKTVTTAYQSTETGTRTQGWSLVRQQVIQPSATPGQYKVTMNSAPTADNGIPIVLHTPSNPYISQSLPGGQK